MSDLKTMSFSQSSLQDYSDCARRFELKYVQQLLWPSVVAEPAQEHEAHMQRGAAFHHMIYQHHLGVPADALASGLDAQLAVWWSAYRASSYAVGGAIGGARHPEVMLSTSVAGHRLVAKYDLLILDDDRATIIDWKTSQKRTPESVLAARWQTRVYRYVLASAGAALNGGQAIAPEQIEMIYWFTADPANVARFPYDTATYQADEAALSDLITEIKSRESFDLTTDTRRCRFCTYRSLCERGVRAGDMADLEEIEDDLTDLDFDFDQVTEIEF